MRLAFLREWLSWVYDSSSPKNAVEEDGNPSREFKSSKRLLERDYIIIDMLNSEGHDSISWCITDPEQVDNPIIYVSSGFTRLTGYEFDEVVNRNCRFLQGAKTEQDDVKLIKDAVKTERECSVNMLNYKKDGSTFRNEFFLAQLRSQNKKVAYFIGIQSAVESDDSGYSGQIPSNPGAMNLRDEISFLT